MTDIIKVKVIKSEGWSIPIGTICDAIRKQVEGERGFKIFHHTGWYWVPEEYVEEAK
jgi:hypothetical protein